MKKPENGFINQEFVDQEWESLNFLAAPNFEQAKEEHKTLTNLIATRHPEIHYLPTSDQVTLDSVYCRDATIVTDFGIVLCDMGKDKRKKEPEQERQFFEHNNIKILGRIESPGTLEGGDVAWLDQNTLAVGHTYRTNYEGIRQLKRLLNPVGVELIVAEMPHYQGPSDVFHLMSVLSPVDFKKAVIYSPLMPIHFRNELLARDYELIEVPDEEFESMAANVLAIAPGECIMVSGNPITKSRLEAAGCTVYEYDGEEISVKGGGGPTCLTRPILREI
ncbi:MAG: arginine deiminase family protein [Cyclobacteriaceae bacterium]